MSVTKAENDSFHRFASQLLNNGGSELSFDECVRHWKMREGDLASIRQGISEEDAGSGRPFDEADADICRKFGWSFDE